MEKCINKRKPESVNIIEAFEMRDLSFFFNPKGAGIIDGQQIGEYLAAKLNPTGGYEDDVCIYVKHVPIGDFPKNSYVNVVDGVGLIPWLAGHPEIGIIVTSTTAMKYLSNKLNRDNIIFIPEHHCNYTNIKRNRREVTAVGVIGNNKGFNSDFEQTKARFNEMGLEFKWLCDYNCRRDVVEFYKTIDIQVNWRNHVDGAHAALHNPLKLANAGSFGIPTISFPEKNYIAEFNKLFIAVDDMDALFENVKILKNNPAIYNAYSQMVLKKAQDYHISKIAVLYKSLARRSCDPII